MGRTVREPMRINLYKAAIFITFLVLCYCPAIFAQELSPANTARYIGHNRWEWTIYLQGREQELNRIQQVQYRLHRTFRPSVIPVKRNHDPAPPYDPKHPFGLTRKGWGIFEVLITVSFDDSPPRQFRHMLDFTASPFTDYHLDLAVNNISQRDERRENWWHWKVYIKGNNESLDKVQCVRYTLHRTFPNPIQEVCERGDTAYPFALTRSGWGEFNIRVRIFLRTGEVRDLEHWLRLE